MKHIFFDFNGTIIDDVDLCLNLLNTMLVNQGKKEISLDNYKDVFKFPIQQYYLDAGISFSNQTFQELSEWFITRYQPASFHCPLYDEAEKTFSYLLEKGYKLYILSASEQNNLLEQTNHFKITTYFEEILGTKNIEASSKVEVAKEYIKEQELDKKELIFIGDTLHDVEVAAAIGAKPILVSCGHQSVNVLKSAGVEILPSIASLRDIL